MPKTSEKTTSLVGRYKKEKNETKLKWTPGQSEDSSNPMHFSPLDNQDIALIVKQEISLETMKNSTI
jgi:hypothetical protein